MQRPRMPRSPRDKPCPAQLGSQLSLEGNPSCDREPLQPLDIPPGRVHDPTLQGLTPTGKGFRTVLELDAISLV